MSREPMSHPVEALIASVVQRVAELPGRTSPDDWPEAMLSGVTHWMRIPDPPPRAGRPDEQP